MSGLLEKKKNNVSLEYVEGFPNNDSNLKHTKQRNTQKSNLKYWVLQILYHWLFFLFNYQGIQ